MHLSVTISSYASGFGKLLFGRKQCLTSVTSFTNNTSSHFAGLKEYASLGWACPLAHTRHGNWTKDGGFHPTWHNDWAETVNKWVVNHSNRSYHRTKYHCQTQANRLKDNNTMSVWSVVCRRNISKAAWRWIRWRLKFDVNSNENFGNSHSNAFCGKVNARPWLRFETEMRPCCLIGIKSETKPRPSQDWREENKSLDRYFDTKTTSLTLAARLVVQECHTIFVSICE